MDYYDSIAGGYDELHGEEQQRKFELIEKHVRIPEKTVILDVGCGSGLSGMFFKCKIIGTDPSPRLLVAGKGRLFQMAVTRAEKLPFKSCSFDIVMTVTAVHNFDDPGSGLMEIERVAKSIVVVSLLKKSQKFDIIKDMINDIFQTWDLRLIEDDPHDVIFILRKI